MSRCVAGQSSEYLDTLFTGGFLGKKSDISDGSLRHDEFRTYNNIVGDYYVAPRFLMRIAMHMAKNYLADHLKGVKVPLILGIWGVCSQAACSACSASRGPPLMHLCIMRPTPHRRSTGTLAVLHACSCTWRKCVATALRI
jgi:hypothetical protein